MKQRRELQKELKEYKSMNISKAVTAKSEAELSFATTEQEKLNSAR